MSRQQTQFFQQPAPRPSRRRVSSHGAQAQQQQSNGGGITNMMQRYRSYILVGGLVVVLGLAYHFYSSKTGKSKPGSQVQQAVRRLRNGDVDDQEASGASPKLKNDPEAIRALQSQVLQYQQHIGALEDALVQRDTQVEQMATQMQQQQTQGASMADLMSSGALGNFPGMQGGGGGVGPNQFSGLHGQVPPVGSQGGGGGGPMSYAMQGGMSTRGMQMTDLNSGFGGGGVASMGAQMSAGSMPQAMGGGGAGGGSFTAFGGGAGGPGMRLG